MDTSLGFSCSINIMQYLETLIVVMAWGSGTTSMRLITHMLEEPDAGNLIKNLNATRILKSLCTNMSKVIAEDLGAVTVG